MKDNYTQVPNCFFKLLPYLTEAEIKITLHIIRQTKGYGDKEEDRISYSQFHEATGVHREGIGNAIISLKAKQIINVTKDFKYSINWEVVRLTNQPDFAEQFGYQTKGSSVSEPETGRKTNRRGSKLVRLPNTQKKDGLKKQKKEKKTVKDWIDEFDKTHPE